MPEQHLVLLLVKLAVAASLASILARSTRFQRMLLREERTLGQRLQMALGCAIIFGAGVATRLLTRGTYQAVDLGLEGSIVLGLLGGYATGLVGGILISIPAMFGGEWMSMPLFAAVGVLGGLLRDVAPDKEDIWRISPFVDQSIWELVRKRNLRRTAFSLGATFAILFAELLREITARVFGAKGVFSFSQNWEDRGAWMTVGVYITTVLAVVLPIRVWASMRNERTLETQQALLNEARLAALSRQINPHFLFNTLNTVASLIRLNPEQARQVVYKLSNILRRLLRQQENLTPLREELSFIDDYLSIEKTRFGDKLQIVKEVEADTLDHLVPSMLLQPIVENSIRHGLSNKIDGGTIHLRASLSGGRVLIVVQDDGVGIPESKLATLFEQGIGVSNVNERLKVLYGETYRMWIDSKPGEGTTTGIEIPAKQPALAAVS
ncbi:MAG: histidine kinase [Bryobacteraceae bacterium]